MRKEKKYHFIYKTTNILSGRYYIGMHSTDNLEDGYLGSGNRLRRAINKYGKEYFVREILEYCETREKLKVRESEIVNLNEIAKKDCINLVVGGTGGFISLSGCTKGAQVTNEKKRLRMINDVEFREKVKKQLLENTIENHKEGLFDYTNLDWTGKKHSEETKAKMKKPKNKGKSNSQYGSMWITNETENKKIGNNDLIPEGWRRGRVIKKKLKMDKEEIIKVASIEALTEIKTCTDYDVGLTDEMLLLMYDIVVEDAEIDTTINTNFKNYLKNNIIKRVCRIILGYKNTVCKDEEEKLNFLLNSLENSYETK